jgi:hypothetical protein
VEGEGPRDDRTLNRPYGTGAVRNVQVGTGPLLYSRGWEWGGRFLAGAVRNGAVRRRADRREDVSGHQ